MDFLTKMSGKKRVTFKDSDGGEAAAKVKRLTDVKYDHEYLEDDHYCNIF